MWNGDSGLAVLHKCKGQITEKNREHANENYVNISKRI